jgi:transcription-repair coupling factor (superfamily II helicase)
VRGVAGSLDALLTAALAVDPGRQILFVAGDQETAIQVADDLRLLLEPSRVSLFQVHGPSAGHSKDDAHRIDGIESLRSLASGDTSVVTTYPAALRVRTPSGPSLRRLVLSLAQGEEVGYDLLIETLASYDFERKDFVEAAGDFSVRGGIIDIFPFVGENPVRLEFSGDRIDSIREFDPISQRSIRALSGASIVPDLLSRNVTADVSGSLLDHLSRDAVILLDDPELIERSLKEEQDAGGEALWPAAEIDVFLRRFPIISLVSGGTPASGTIDFGAVPQPSFNGSVRILQSHLRDRLDQDFRVFLLSESHLETRRLKELLTEPLPGIEAEEADGAPPDISKVTFLHHSLHEGWYSTGLRLALYTEHQIFGRKKRRGRRRRGAARGLSAREVQHLQKRDFVVHADYGIGMFDGLTRIKVQGIEHEVLRILYEGKDVLYVNLNYVNRVQKYSSKEGHVPALTRLGSGEWQKLRARAKKRIKDIARDLITLYARRKSLAGHAFPPDTPWQKEMEASFVFEDTFDQARATRDVKQDMEAPHPMDRLICGDVGFGKTEVAIRAAFKAVMGGKQVAVLVPTTILAIQHHNTFIDRLARYSVRIESLSRLKNKATQTELTRRLTSGQIDIVIGTHRLLSKDIGFKDLGLLIIDEEQRFGVSAKEKLRQLRSSVDTLTLTATPIPRTLHFSLMGARDLSLIATPPRNRVPIITEIVEFNEHLIREAVMREVHRGGQVYIVHDRIQTMEEFIERIKGIVPGVRIRHAHGQMHARELEDVMVEFLEKKFDVLVSTKIIESGLDIPNVNTIVVNRADRFGMAELYQLRGRVGRSNVQAYALLITPPKESLSRDAMRRLQAMREFTELGSGFGIAMRDLEIRGAGNMLGSEQSGFIVTMGFETYTRILEEAVGELKSEEFESMFGTEQQKRPDETAIDSEMEALIPEEYVESDTERLEVYRRLYAVNREEQISEIGEALSDRFGPHPLQVQTLLDLLRLRLDASAIGLKKISVSPVALTVELPSPDDESFYAGGRFDRFLAAVAKQPADRFSLQESRGKLLMRAPLAMVGRTFLQPARNTIKIIAEMLEAGETITN